MGFDFRAFAKKVKKGSKKIPAEFVFSPQNILRFLADEPEIKKYIRNFDLEKSERIFPDESLQDFWKEYRRRRMDFSESGFFAEIEYGWVQANARLLKKEHGPDEFDLFAVYVWWANKNEFGDYTLSHTGLRADILQQARLLVEPKALEVESVKIKQEKTKAAIEAKNGGPVSSEPEKMDYEDLRVNLARDLKGLDIPTDMLAAYVAAQDMGVLSKPTLSFIFPGPSDCGQREVIDSLGLHMGRKIIHFPAAQFFNKENTVNLIGTANNPESGAFTAPLQQNPGAIFVFSKIESVGYLAWRLLLDMIQTGSIRNGEGKIIDASKAVFIFLFDYSVAMEEALKADNDTPAKKVKGYKDYIDYWFGPDFLNTAHLIPFLELNEAGELSIFDSYLARLSEKLTAHNITLVVNQESKQKILRKTQVAEGGTVNISEVFEETIVQPLILGIGQKRFKAGDTISLSCKKETVSLEVHPASSSRTRPLSPTEMAAKTARDNTPVK